MRTIKMNRDTYFRHQDRYFHNIEEVEFMRSKKYPSDNLNSYLDERNRFSRRKITPSHSQLPQNSTFSTKRDDLRVAIRGSCTGNGVKEPSLMNTVKHHKWKADVKQLKPFQQKNSKLVPHTVGVTDGALKWNNMHNNVVKSVCNNDVITISSDSDCEFIEVNQSNTASHTKNYVKNKQKRDGGRYEINNISKNDVAPYLSNRSCMIEDDSKCLTTQNTQMLKRKRTTDEQDSTESSSSSLDNCKHRRIQEVSDHKDAQNRDRRKRSLQESDLFSRQIYGFFTANQQRPSFLNEKLDLVQALQKTLCNTLFPGAKLYLVGSSVNGFGRKRSDADMCLVLHNVSKMINKKPMSVLHKLRSLLQHADFVKQLKVIPAKVCILKFKAPRSGIEVDINVDCVTGIRNTYLMLAYAKYDPRVQPLVMCVKEWAHCNNINDASEGTFSSYALCLMVVHYLQVGTVPSVLPSLQKVYPHLFSGKLPLNQIRKHAMQVPPGESHNYQTLSQLLLGFFTYFSTFDFSNIMSIRNAKTIPFDECQRISKGDPWSNKFIRIEEPFNLTNVTRAVQNNIVPRLIRKFSQARITLNETKNLCNLIHKAPHQHDFVA